VDGRLTDRLHHVEHTLAGLLEYQLADEGAEAADVLPQRIILGFECKRLSCHVRASRKIQAASLTDSGEAIMIRVVVTGRNVSAATFRK
jgi:hypothetical protein